MQVLEARLSLSITSVKIRGEMIHWNHIVPVHNTFSDDMRIVPWGQYRATWWYTQEYSFQRKWQLNIFKD